MKFVLTFDCDNSAFEPDATDEILTILEQVRRHVADQHIEHAVIDTNGNRVGRYVILGAREPASTTPEDGFAVGWVAARVGLADVEAALAELTEAGFAFDEPWSDAFRRGFAERRDES
jgi:hypothetical protein